MIKTDPWLPVDSLQLLYQLFDDLGALPVRHELFSEQEVQDDLKGLSPEIDFKNVDNNLQNLA
jgi:hypothetical protein